MDRIICFVVWIIAVLWTMGGCVNISDRNTLGMPALVTGDVLTPIYTETRRRKQDSTEYVATATYKAICTGNNLAITLKAVEETITVNPAEKLYGSLQGERARKHLALSELVVRFGDVAVHAPQPALRMFKEPHLGRLSFKCLSSGCINLSLPGSDGGEAYTARFFYRDSRLARVEVWQRGPDARLHPDRVWP